MIDFLKNHPFAVKAHFKRSIVLTFAVPKSELADRIPPCVELDVFENKWAFVAVALVQTKGLRPAAFPKALGNNFSLIGYRIFVKYHSPNGKRLRGLYILKSETDRKKMQWLGSLFTRYKYTTTDIQHKTAGSISRFWSDKSNFEFEVESMPNCPLPSESPFAEWRIARRYAGPLPFTFSFRDKTKQVLIIEGVRQNWTPKPIKVNSHRFKFLDSLGLSKYHLANAFEITDVPYQWKKGRLETWG